MRFAVLAIPLTLVLSLGLGLFLRNLTRGAGFFRALVYAPVLAPVVIAGLMWLFLVNPDFGLFNLILRAVGLPGQVWLADPTLAPIVVIALEVWRGVAFWSLFFLAALIGLPSELYEAAHADGATTWQRFRFITMPLLKRAILFALVVATISNLADLRRRLCDDRWRTLQLDGHRRLVHLQDALRLQPNRVWRRAVVHPAGRHPRADAGRDAASPGQAERLMEGVRRPTRVASPVNDRMFVARRFRARRPAEAGPATRAISYVVVAVVAFVCILPFFFIISASLKDSTLLFHYPPEWIPNPIYWGNYVTLLTQTQFPRWVFNTLLVAGTVTILKVVIDSMAGYAFAKLDFPFKEVLFVVFIAAMMIPFSAIMIPLYFTVRGLGLLNTYPALILPALAEPIGIFLMRQFIAGVPTELTNAARLDGESEFGIYWRVVLPLVKPGLVVLAVVTFLSQYTSFAWPLVAVSSNSMMVINTGLATQRSELQVNYGLFSAGAVMALIPITIFFLLLQKYFIAGSLVGSLKQ